MTDALSGRRRTVTIAWSVLLAITCCGSAAARIPMQDAPDTQRGPERKDGDGEGGPTGTGGGPGGKNRDGGEATQDKKDGAGGPGPNGLGRDRPGPLDPLRLTRPSRSDLEHPNVPTVIASGIEPGERANRGATVVTRNDRAYLITTLDALAFESGRRTVDIALVQHGDRGCDECAVLKDIDSFRFHWTDTAPDHCAIELRPEELESVRSCRTWAFFDRPDVPPPAGDGDTDSGGRLQVGGKGVILQAGAERNRYDPLSASTSTDVDAPWRLRSVPIDPAVTPSLDGCSFVSADEGDWLWLVGIGSGRGRARPVVELLGTPALTELLAAVADGTANPVSELLMLQRRLAREGVPASYAGMREFLAENGVEGLLTWREVLLTGGTHELSYRIEQRPGVAGARVIATAAYGIEHDLTLAMRTRQPGGWWSSTDADKAPDAMVAIAEGDLARLEGGTGVDLTLMLHSRSSVPSRVLLIEATPTCDAAPALPNPTSQGVPK